VSRIIPCSHPAGKIIDGSLLRKPERVYEHPNVCNVTKDKLRSQPSGKYVSRFPATKNAAKRDNVELRVHQMCVEISYLSYSRRTVVVLQFENFHSRSQTLFGSDLHISSFRLKTSSGRITAFPIGDWEREKSLCQMRRS